MWVKKDFKKFLRPPKLEQTDLTMDELSTVAKIPNTNRNRLISTVEIESSLSSEWSMSFRWDQVKRAVGIKWNEPIAFESATKNIKINLYPWKESENSSSSWQNSWGDSSSGRYKQSITSKFKRMKVDSARKDETKKVLKDDYMKNA